MLYKYLPLDMLGIKQNNNETLVDYEVIKEFSVDQFNKMLRKYNIIWVIQIFIAWLYCIKIKRFVPTQANAKISIIIKQFLAYLFTNAIIYILEMLFSNTFFTMFERFAHHVVAIILFYVCYLKQNIISVAFLTPFLIHSIYWLEHNVITKYSNELLLLYNLSLLTNSVFIMYTTYNRTVKLYSLRVLILSGLLYNVNIFGDRYHYNVEIFNLDYKKAKDSLWFSLATSTPLYSYLIYVNYEKLRSFCRKPHHDTNIV